MLQSGWKLTEVLEVSQALPARCKICKIVCLPYLLTSFILYALYIYTQGWKRGENTSCWQASFSSNKLVISSEKSYPFKEIVGHHLYPPCLTARCNIGSKQEVIYITNTATDIIGCFHHYYIWLPFVKIVLDLRHSLSSYR